MFSFNMMPKSIICEHLENYNPRSKKSTLNDNTIIIKHFKRSLTENTTMCR